ncbi:MAG: PP2C family protein-serine/threonine phosphatase [Planctomycetaceae bacterium]
MARSKRAKEGGGDRPPPPPRMSGMGLGATALLSAVGAAIVAFLAILAATGSSSSVERHADNLGAALTAVLTTPDPMAWSQDYATFEYLSAWVKRHYDEAGVKDYPAFPAEAYKRQQGKDHEQRQRNLKRLQETVDRAMGLVQGGTLRGLQIQFERGTNLRTVTAGEGLPAGAEFKAQRQLGGDVGMAVYQMQSLPGGARIYRREYKASDGRKVGDAYVILSEELIRKSGGAGMWIFLGPLLVGAVAGVGILGANRAATGIRALARDLEAIGRGRLDLRVSTSAGGEVGYAQRTAERMAKNLQLIQTTGSGDLDEAVTKELDMAGQIHASLRPQDPPRLPGYELETLFKAGRDIGGDYFDYVELEGGRFAILLADCAESMRGVPAAMVMAMTRAYLKTTIAGDSSPADWLKAANRRLSRDLKAGMAVTALICVLEPATGEVVAVSAGHRPMVLWRQGKTATINPNGIALGLDIGPVFEKTLEEKRLTLQKNDRLVLYTDGVLSAKNDGGEMYGEDRFLESVRRQGGMNSAAFVNFAAGGVDAWCGGAGQDDDITICTLKRSK